MSFIYYFQCMVVRSPCLIFLLLFAMAGTAAAQQRQTDTLIVHFAFDKSVVSTADSALIKDYFFNRNLRIDSVRVIGYTDTVGTEAYNLRLSKRRAISAAMDVALWLEQERPIEHFEYRGEAEAIPGEDSLSRRAVIFIYYRSKDTTPVVHAEPPPPDTTNHPEGEPDTIIAMHNINFVANTVILTDAARLALPQNVPMLRQLGDRYLEIDGYCNQPGPLLPKTDPLFILSVKRAKYIYDYLIAQGFDTTHLSYRGMGNASPKNEHPVTKADMDENMRVEIRVFRTAPKP
jgi:outer membrane protein OmpA-like peptidoglycan-associated protein